MKKVLDRIKKILAFRLPDAAVLLIFLAVAVTMFIPLYRLCSYTIPYCDDYDAFLYPKVALKDTPGMIGLIKGAAAYSSMEWYSFQGTFVSCFMMAFNTFVFDPSTYGIGCAGLITVMGIAVFTFLTTIAVDIFGAGKLKAMALGLGGDILTVLFIYTAQQGFFWYDGGVHYIFIHSALILGLSALIHAQYTHKTGVKVLMFFLAMVALFIVGGGNYSTLTQAFLLVPFVFVSFWIVRKKFPLWQLPPLLVFAIGAYFNMSAPGNNVRSAHFNSPFSSPLRAILQSFVEAVKFLPDFIDWRTLLMILALIPIMHRIVKETNYRFSWVKFLLFAFFSSGLYASGYTSILYATGAVDLSRVVNVIKLTFQLLVILNLMYFMGLLEQLSFVKEKAGFAIGYVWFIPLWLVVWLWFLKIQPNPIGTYSAWGADYYLRTGQAEQSHNEYLERLKILEGPESEVVLTPYTNLPWFLGWRDLSEDPAAEQNVFMARYYDKDSVRIPGSKY